jgi:sugar phosphate isomerase/epimerase
MVESLTQLCNYAGGYGLNVLIENHGLYSSDARWISEIIRRVNLPNCGTLPDFGNWCLSTKWGTTESGKECPSVYDRYAGVAELLPFARGVSAKSYAFDEQGQETTIDYARMLRLVQQSGYSGHIGIEFEGARLSESAGIRATKSLLEKQWAQLNHVT